MASMDPEFYSLEENSVESSLDLDENLDISGRSDEPKAKMKSMFSNYVILKKIRKISSSEDLHKLRQLSSTYNDIMALKYFDLLDLTVWIWAHRKCKPECDHSKYNYPSTITMTKDSKAIKSITNSNWTHEMAYMFRNLVLGDILFDQMNIYTSDGLSFQTVISQISPNISNLSIRYTPQSSDFANTGAQLSEFLGQFQNLKTLDIAYEIVEANCCSRNSPMPVNQLKSVLENVNPNTTIELNTNQKCIEVANTFGTDMKNLTIYLDFKGSPDLWAFKNACENYGNLTNIKFKFADEIYVSDLRSLQYYVETLVRYQHLIKCLGIVLFVRDPNVGIYGEDEDTQIKEHLKKIVPFLNTLIILFEDGRKKFDIFNIPDCNWSNLESLSIYDYDLPLDVLKKCTNLIQLGLNVNLGTCIFHNLEQTPEENLKEYLGNLTKLEKIEFHNREEMDFTLIQGVANNNELVALLKKILPNDARIVFGYLEEDSDEIKEEEEEND